MCKTACYRIRNLDAFRKSLDLTTAKTAAAAFMISSLDYCNASLRGLPKNHIHRILLVQNSAARVIRGLKTLIILLKPGKINTDYLLKPDVNSK